MSAGRHVLCEAMKKAITLPPLPPSVWSAVLEAWSKHWHDLGFKFCPYCGWKLSPYVAPKDIPA